MSIIDTVAIIKYHKNLAIQYGEASSGALGWKLAAGQTARFEILSNIADMNNQMVLDLGCGHGDLRGFLDDKYPNVIYAGIDQLNNFLDVAYSKYGHLPSTQFYQGDFWASNLPEADYILASGALSYRNSDPNFIFSMIGKLFAHCKKGLAFNLLSKVDNADSILVSYDPQQILAYCQQLTSNAQLITGYFEEDFTLMLYK